MQRAKPPVNGQQHEHDTAGLASSGRIWPVPAAPAAAAPLSCHQSPASPCHQSPASPCQQPTWSWSLPRPSSTASMPPPVLPLRFSRVSRMLRASTGGCCRNMAAARSASASRCSAGSEGSDSSLTNACRVAQAGRHQRCDWQCFMTLEANTRCYVSSRWPVLSTHVQR